MFSVKAHTAEQSPIHGKDNCKCKVPGDCRNVRGNVKKISLTI